MTADDFEEINKRITNLDKKIDTVSFLLFSYVQAILLLMNDKELTNPEELKEYLERSKQGLLQMGQNAQFEQMMKDVFPDEKDPGNAPQEAV